MIWDPTNDDHRRENRSPEQQLIAESSELLDFQTRRLLEESFKETEKQVRTLVADLVEGMWAQQRRVIGIRQHIQQYEKREGMVDKGMVPSLDERASS